MTGAAQPSAHTELPTRIRLGRGMPRRRSVAVASDMAAADSPAAPKAPHAVIVFTYDWLPVNTVVRGVPDTFLNAFGPPRSFQMMTVLTPR